MWSKVQPGKRPTNQSKSHRAPPTTNTHLLTPVEGRGRLGGGHRSRLSRLGGRGGLAGLTSEPYDPGQQPGLRVPPHTARGQSLVTRDEARHGPSTTLCASAGELAPQPPDPGISAHNRTLVTFPPHPDPRTRPLSPSCQPLLEQAAWGQLLSPRPSQPHAPHPRLVLSLTSEGV